MNPRSDDGLKIGVLSIRLVQGRNTKLIIFRNDRGDLPHLTISWGNLSGEVDLHLKKRLPGGREDHEPVATIQESRVAMTFRSFGLELLRLTTHNMYSLPKVRPGWLARNGYVISYLPEDAKAQLIQKVAPNQRRHGKSTRVVQWDVIEVLGQSPELNDNIYHPAILHDLVAIGWRGHVFAEIVRGNRKGRLMALQLLTKPNGTRVWVRIDNLAKAMMKASADFLGSSFRELLGEEAWTRIHYALRLNEIGLKRESSHLL